MNIDKDLDLVISKTLDISPEQAWKGWTTPELFKEWFCPKPWKVTEARIDVRPGGEFFTVMQSPEGHSFPNTGCILEVIPGKKLVWTSELHKDYKPANNKEMGFTAILLFEAQGNQTKYTAIAKHGNAEDRKKHESMGFVEGWGIVADQLAETMKAHS